MKLSHGEKYTLNAFKTAQLWKIWAQSIFLIVES